MTGDVANAGLGSGVRLTRCTWGRGGEGAGRRLRAGLGERICQDRLVRCWGMMSAMRIELLVVPDCPNAAPARDLLSSILDEHRLMASVVTTVVSTGDEARARGFTGSPTFLLDGIDPFAQDGAGVGLACRVYRGAHGLTGLPDRDALASALTSPRTREQ